MPLVVMVSRDMARLLRGNKVGASEAAIAALGEIEDALASLPALRPSHAVADDSRLSQYFQIDGVDRIVGESLIARLLPLAGIEAAYWKPETELPGL